MALRTQHRTDTGRHNELLYMPLSFVVLQCDNYLMEEALFAKGVASLLWRCDKK